nr:hypothetical protein [Gemmatimonadaceae bacterium]
MRQLLLALPVVLAASTAQGQVVRSRSYAGPPAAWISAGVGQIQGWSVIDGTTSTRWDFGNSTQYGASLERAFANGGGSGGLRATTARVPLRHTAKGAAFGNAADATVSQLLGTVRLAGGAGFHSVLEISGGATLYSNFTSRVDGAKLEPLKTDPDFTFAFGYGFGYAFSP